MITVDATSYIPPFEQIRSQVAHDIRHGTLAAGTRLPTVRRLAGDLGVAPNTVARAYRELEAAGMIETHGRAGTTVRATDETRGQLAAAAAEYARLTLALGVTDDDAVAQLRAVLQAERGDAARSPAIAQRHRSSPN